MSTGSPRLRGARVLGAFTVTLALLASVAGAVLWQQNRAAAGGPPGMSAEAAGLRATVDRARWTSMEAHHMDGGQQMPSQMMPGAPEGDDQRLGIPVVLTNTTDETRKFDTAEEFFLLGGHRSGAKEPKGADDSKGSKDAKDAKDAKEPKGSKRADAEPAGPRSLHSDTLGGLPALAPGNSVRGVLYFDLEVPRGGDPALRLLWKRDGSTRELAVRLSGAAPEHGGHGS
ncbi:hypothetical protein ACXZ65_31735 [Streptomyces aculeolatus]